MFFKYKTANNAPIDSATTYLAAFGAVIFPARQHAKATTGLRNALAPAILAMKIEMANDKPIAIAKIIGFADAIFCRYNMQETNTNVPMDSPNNALYILCLLN